MKYKDINFCRDKITEEPKFSLNMFDNVSDGDDPYFLEIYFKVSIDASLSYDKYIISKYTPIDENASLRGRFENYFEYFKDNSGRFNRIYNIIATAKYA